MNWKRIKTFLIILFLLINIYLISTTSGMFFSNTTLTKIDKETVSETKKLISDNYDIDVSDDLIPLEFVNLANINVTNLIFDDRALNSKYDFTQTETGFECLVKTKTYSYTEEIAKKEIEDILSDVGIELESYKMKFIKSDHGLLCNINEYVSQYPVFDGQIYVEFTPSLIKLKGNWYFPEHTDLKKNDNSERLTDITSVLIDCVSSHCVKDDSKQDITNIEYGYFVSYYDENIITKSASAIPSYMFETSEGNKYYYDAYSGKFLKQEE